jgi:hypothetical protein
MKSRARALIKGTLTSPSQTGSNILEYGKLSEQSGNVIYIENVRTQSR